jgi:hypothetical protein
MIKHLPLAGMKARVLLPAMKKKIDIELPYNATTPLLREMKTYVPIKTYPQPGACGSHL